MNESEMRIAIAEACGWKLGPPLCNPKGEIVNAHYHEEWRLPDYYNDLNAMRNAEQTLKPGLSYEYAEELAKVLGFELHIACFDDIYDMATATAAQRAEAFLRTIGKWKEDK